MPRRGENIYKRGDGRWEGRYIRGRTPEGRAQYGYVYAATYSACREKRRQRLRELPREITPSNNMTLPEAVELFFVEREQKRKLKESTVSRYRYVVRQYMRQRHGLRGRWATEKLSPTPWTPKAARAYAPQAGRTPDLRAARHGQAAAVLPSRSIRRK